MSTALDSRLEQDASPALRVVGSTAWFGVGDDVSVERWDKTERPEKRIGSPAKVIALETDKYCETGIMVTVLGTSGKVLTVDMNWLRPHSPNAKLRQDAPANQKT
jgi:hypothetical protein